MPKKTPDPNQAPSLRDLSLDHIGMLADVLRKSDSALSREQAVRLAVTSPQGREAHRIYNLQGSELPWDQAIGAIVKSELARRAPVPISMRAQILAKRALTEGGSGPLGSMIEDPMTSGPKAPASTLPAQAGGVKITPPITPADALLANIHAEALRAAPPGTSQEQATAAFLGTGAGQALHAAWNAARAAQ